MKKIMSVLLLLCMLLALLPVAALADGEEAAVGPAAEATAEMSEEESAELSTPGSSEELADAPVSDAVAETSADMPPEEENTPEEQNDEASTDAEQMYVAGQSATAAISLLDGDGTNVASYCLVVSMPPVSTRANGSVSFGENNISDAGASMSEMIPEGTPVTLVARGDEGYGRIVPSAYYYNEESSKGIELDMTESPAGTYTFTMPSGKVNIAFNFYPTDAVKLTYHYVLPDGTELDCYETYVAKNAATMISLELGMTRLETGKVLSGWAVGSPEGEKLTEGYYTFTEDTELYSIIEDGVKLTFHHPRGEYSYYCVKGELTGCETEWEYNGQIVTAWTTQPDGGGTVYIPGVGPTYRFTQDTELYPVLKDAVDVAVYFTDGTPWHTFTIGKGESYTPDEVLGATAVSYWAVGSVDSDTHYQPGETIIVTEDIALYPVAAETVKITFKNTGMAYYDPPQYAIKGETTALPSETDVVDQITVPPIGQAFLGWSRTEGGEIIGQTASFSEDTTLYAIFAPAALVIYDANGGECSGRYYGRYSRAVGSYLTEYTAADNFVTREGYTLTGWTTDKEGRKPFDFSKPITGHTTLYAVWEKITNEKTDTSTGVTVEVPEDDKDKIAGLVFVASPLPDDKETLVVTVIGKQMSGKVEKSYVLDIYFANAVTGEEVEVGGQRTVTVPIPEGWDAKNTMVLFVDTETGRVENMRGTVSADGKTISFTASHFSYYALVQMESEPSPAPTPEATPAASAAPTASAAPDNTAERTQTQSPKTGDEAKLALWMVLLCASVLLVPAAAQRRKQK